MKTIYLVYINFRQNYIEDFAAFSNEDSAIAAAKQAAIEFSGDEESLENVWTEMCDTKNGEYVDDGGSSITVMGLTLED